MNNIYAALEIGTSKTVLAIGETKNGERLKVTTISSIPSAGIRKSQIIDVHQATESIRAVLQAVKKKQNKSGNELTIGNVFLTVSGQHITSVPSSASVSVEKSKISEADVDEVNQAAQNITLPKNRELLDVVSQDYVVGQRGGILNPVGISGTVLTHNVLAIHADKDRINDAKTAAEAAHLEIRDSIYATSAAAEAVLEDYEKKNGVLVIDFGGGSTSYAAYTDGYLTATGVIGVGGDHITNDIAQAFQTTMQQAELLKIREASAQPFTGNGVSARVKVELGDNTLMDNRTISRRALNTVVNARCLELLEIIHEEIEAQDLLHRLHSGIVMTGGGSRLNNLDALIEHDFGVKTRLGRPLQVDFAEELEYPPAYATIAGTLLYAHRNYEEKSVFGDIIGRIFK